VADEVAALNHPHTCQIFDLGPDYPVLEYIEGQPFLSQAKPGPLAAEEAVRLAAEIAEALDAAHRKGMVHRDLKPANAGLSSLGATSYAQPPHARRSTSAKSRKSKRHAL
jgi:serine/threonine protein kinase